MIARLRNRYLLGALTAAYLAVLTFCLVARNPFWIAGRRESSLRWMFEQFVAPVSHLLAFLVAGFLCGLVCSRNARGIVLGVLACYAFATEGVQFLVPDRTPEWLDVLQNMLGVCAGMGLAAWMRRHEDPMVSPQGSPSA